MKKLFITILILISANLAFAESLIKYDPADITVPNRVVEYKPTGDQSIYLSDPNDITSVTGNYIIDADLSAVAGIKRLYWKVVDGNVVEWTLEDKAAWAAKIAQDIANAENAKASAFDDRIIAAKDTDAALPKIDAIIDSVDSFAKWRMYEKKKMRYLLNKE